jgi:hypothetical protein
MAAVICTLFEGNYHYGVAALVNSLYKQGFTGDFYIGYRGELPPWTGNFRDGEIKDNFVNKSLDIKENLRLNFVSLKTDYHLANYKPDFMLDLLRGPAKEATSIFYFDPDIIVTREWRVFENWIIHGVAVCEDVNSPLAQFHPRRSAWRQYFAKQNIKLEFKNAIYVNSGFVGVKRTDIGFLLSWVKIQEAIAPEIGGLNRSPFVGAGFLSEEARGDYSPFSKTDQDALNAAIEEWNGIVSFIGQEGMAFKPGPKLMSHALGKPKSWQWRVIAQMCRGNAPRVADKDYWISVSLPIRLYSQKQILLKNILIKSAAFISRFYRR